MENSVGESTAPCGTPASVFLVVERDRSILIWNVLPRRNESVILTRRRRIRRSIILYIRTSVRTRSKAFRTSSRTAPVISFLRNRSFIVSTTLRACSSVPSPLLKANWCSGRMLWSSRYWVCSLWCCLLCVGLRSRTFQTLAVFLCSRVTFVNSRTFWR